MWWCVCVCVRKERDGFEKRNKCGEVKERAVCV